MKDGPCFSVFLSDSTCVIDFRWSIESEVFMRLLRACTCVRDWRRSGAQVQLGVKLWEA